MNTDAENVVGRREQRRQVEKHDAATDRMQCLLDASDRMQRLLDAREEATSECRKRALEKEFQLAKEDAERVVERYKNAKSKRRQQKQKTAPRASSSHSPSSSFGSPQDTSQKTKETTLEALIRRSQIVRQCKIAGPSHDTTLALVELPDGGGFLLAIGFPNPGASSSFQHVRGGQRQALTVYAEAQKRLERQARQEWVSEGPKPQDARANAKAKPLLSRWIPNLS